MVASHGRVLVHCRAGRSHSVAVVAGHLVVTEGTSTTDALSRVSALRASFVAPELRAAVERLAAVDGADERERDSGETTIHRVFR